MTPMIQQRPLRSLTRTNHSTWRYGHRQRVRRSGADPPTGSCAKSSASSLVSTLRATGMRQNSAARVYPAIICALDRAGLCSWSLESGKLPQSADESVKVRTEETAQAATKAKKTFPRRRTLRFLPSCNSSPVYAQIVHF